MNSEGGDGEKKVTGDGGGGVVDQGDDSRNQGGNGNIIPKYYYSEKALDDDDTFLDLKTSKEQENTYRYGHEPQTATMSSGLDSGVDDADSSSSTVMIIRKETNQPTTTTHKTDAGIGSICPASGQTAAGKFAISDWMNDNLLVARYGLVASIALLTAYGVAHSPLLFRYRHVSDIPAELFSDRRILHCRLVGYETTSNHRTTLWCRHLSLAERLLKPTGMLSWKPAPSTVKAKTNHIGTAIKKECIPIQLVGVEAPELVVSSGSTSTKEPSSATGSLLQFMSSTTKQPEPTSRDTATMKTTSFLDDLVKRPTYVSCQLMARGVATRNGTASNNNDSNNNRAKKRPIPDHVVNVAVTDGTNINTTTIGLQTEQLAFGKIWYRPKGPFQISATDLGLQLIERGEAVVASDLYGSSHPDMEIVDHTTTSASRGGGASATSSTKRLQRDAAYVAQTLANGEKAACRQARGVWNNERYRRQRQDFVDEVEFWDKASWHRKVWRWLTTRGG